MHDPAFTQPGDPTCIVTEFGEKTQLAPVGKPVHDSETPPVKPPLGVTVTVLVADWPGATEPEVLEAPMENPAGTVVPVGAWLSSSTFPAMAAAPPEPDRFRATATPPAVTLRARLGRAVLPEPLVCNVPSPLPRKMPAPLVS